MMIKIFTMDKNGKINLSQQELKELLDEAYWEGYRNNNHTWIYNPPSWNPYITTACGNDMTIKLSNDAYRDSVITNNLSSTNYKTDNNSKGCGKNCTEGCGWVD